MPPWCSPFEVQVPAQQVGTPDPTFHECSERNSRIRLRSARHIVPTRSEGDLSLGLINTHLWTHCGGHPSPPESLNGIPMLAFTAMLIVLAHGYAPLSSAPASISFAEIRRIRTNTRNSARVRRDPHRRDASLTIPQRRMAIQSYQAWCEGPSGLVPVATFHSGEKVTL